jgi:outer membrane receptor protein involved in Fe transport
MKHQFLKNSLALAISLASTVAIAEEAAADSSTKKLNTVTVTGQKMERSLQDTKESVVVLTSEDLETRNLTELTDVIQQTPGISGDQFGFRIRGVRSSDGAINPNRGDLASVVIDGVTTSGWIKSGAVGQLWDVSQVEILRGPQSTNLGRNALAGAIIVNTSDPVYANEGKVRLGFGNYGQREYKGVANINLMEGISALRLSAEHSQSDGFIDNITRNEKDYNGRENTVYRMKLLLEPTDDLKMVLSYQHLENEYGDSRVLLGEFDKDDRKSTNDADAVFKTKADLASLNLDFKINHRWALKSISAYQDGERDRLSDTDLSALAYGSGGGTVIQDNEDTNWSQELRLNFNSDTVRGSTGVYYTSIEAKNSQVANNDLNLVTQFDSFARSQNINFPLGQFLTNPINLVPFGGSGTLSALYPEFYGTEQTGFTNVETTSWAVFTEWDVDFAENWTASFGARYDNEKKEYSTGSNSISPNTLPTPLGAPYGSAGIGAVTLDSIIGIANAQLSSFAQNVPETDKSKSFNNILPHAGITYHWNEDVTTSFFAKKSYRSGGSELTLLHGVNDFDQEELWNYELALRSELLDGRGLLNANIYYSDWKDQQVKIQELGTSSSAYTITENSGRSELYGAELSFDYILTETLDLYVGGALSNTEYKDFKSADGSNDYSGNEFTFAPKHTAMTGLNYQSFNGFFLNTSMNYQGKSYSDVANEKELSARTLVNINGGYEIQDLKLEVYVKNVFDRTYANHNNLQAANGTPAVRMGDPRVIGARATYNF